MDNLSLYSESGDSCKTVSTGSVLGGDQPALDIDLFSATDGVDHESVHAWIIWWRPVTGNLFYARLRGEKTVSHCRRTF